MVLTVFIGGMFLGFFLGFISMALLAVGSHSCKSEKGDATDDFDACAWPPVHKFGP